MEQELLKQLEYPSDPALFLEKKKALKKYLLSLSEKRLPVRIAVLGASTTHDLIAALELFLLHAGIEPVFYESEYGQYYQEVMFHPEALKAFKPDVIFIHTSFRSLQVLPSLQDDAAVVMEKLRAEVQQFTALWQKIRTDYECVIIQNNFDPPPYRLLGNKDVSDIHGTLCFINELNRYFAEYARENGRFYINDLNYLSACCGLEKWHDVSAWALYKYCCAIDCLPLVAFSVFRMIKSVYGKNKKAFCLDLDNTLWGGVISEDGIAHIDIGHETPTAQAYTEFQKYLKAHQDLGVLLTLNSKNDLENALAGLNHSESVLTPNDFAVIKANWQPKSLNLIETAKELNLLPESFVFVDDNPVERDIVETQVTQACVPEIKNVETYIRDIDRYGYFETTALSADDLSRVNMYRADQERRQEQQSFLNYDDYLKSLAMTAEIKPFCSVFLPRIAQLTNKSNQFNVTTKRYSEAELERLSQDKSFLCLSGRLTDKFGDNGIVSVAIARIEKTTAHIELFLMSCRVLKRNMEYAVLDVLAEQAKRAGATVLRGYYYKTEKNAMVENLYADFGFSLKEQNGSDSVWELNLADYQNHNTVITVEE